MGNTLKVRFEEVPAAGSVYNDAGFQYEVVNSRPHTNRDGTPSMLIEWRGQCAECGCDISFKTGASVYSFPRRCKAHNMGWVRATPFGSAKDPATESAVPGREDRRRKWAAENVNAFMNAFCDYMRLMEGAKWRASEDDIVEFFNRQFPEWGEDD